MFAQGSKSTLYYRDLIKEVSEESILEYYSGITTIPCIIQSPFREDLKPSFSVFYSRTGRIHFKDFASNESYSLLDFIRLKLNLNNISEVVEDILNHIDGIKSIDRYIIKSHRHEDKNRVTRSKRIKDLRVRTREWREYDLEFWESFGIGLRWLEFGNIYPISHILIDNRSFTADKYAYCYVEFKDGLPTFKIYQPYSDTWKWMNNHDSSVWDLWTQVMRSTSKELIITSSRKDALCIWANTGIPSTALQSESTLPKPHIISQLYEKFDKIWCLYDNDFSKEKNYGREFGGELVELYSFKQVEIPEFYKSKDPSDLYKNHGSFIFKQVLNQIIK